MSSINVDIQLAPMLFATAADDALAVPDIYAVSPTAAQNVLPALPDTGIGAIISSATSLVQNSGLLAQVNGAADRIKGVLANAVTPINALNTLTTILGGNAGAIANLEKGTLVNLLNAAGLPSPLTATLTAGIMGVPGALSPKSLLFATVPEARIIANDVESIRRIPDAYKTGGVIGLVQALATNAGLGDVAQYLDLTAQLNTVTSILGEVSAMGIPDLVDVVIASLQADDDRARVLLRCCMVAAQNSDLYTLQQAISYCGQHRIMATYPTIVSVILANYRPIADTDYVTTADRDALLGVLDGIDPNWATYNRQGTPVVALLPFVSCNAAAKAALIMSDTYRPAAMIAGSYPVAPLPQVVKSQYPHLALPLN